jgi:porin
MNKFLLALVLALPTAALSATTNSVFARWAEQTYMLGDWDGARPWLSSHGIDFEFLYVGSLPSNLGGGIKTGSAYQGGIAAMLDLDSEKLLGYEGGTLHVSGIWLHGHELFSADYSGDYNRVNLVDFDNALRLWELYYRQKFFDGKFSAKVGRLSIDSDFIVPEYFTSFGQFSLLNQTFAFPTLPFNVFTPPGFPATSHGLPSMPLATPGAVLAWNPAPEFTVQAGAFSGSPDQSYSGSHWPISQRDGALNYLEVAWRHNLGTNNPHLGGTVKLGGYYHTSQFTDVYEGVYFAAGLNPAPRQRTGNYGGYLMAEHQLYLENGKADPAQQGLLGFFRALAASLRPQSHAVRT